jgi:hypothetical protein
VSEIRRAVVKSYDAAAHKADVQIAGSLAVWLDAIRVATNIPAADVVSGRQCTVLFLDPSNQDDAVIITIQGALPSTGELLEARATADLTLTTTAQSITGDGDSSKVRLLLPTAGDWLIESACDFHVTVMDPESVIGQLHVNDSGTAESAKALLRASGVQDRSTITQRWKITTTAANVPVELKALKSAAAGTARARTTHTTLHAQLARGNASTIDPSATVVSETTFGQAAAAGSASPYSRGDHTHGSPTDPVPTHAAIIDAHAMLAAANAWAALQTFNAGIALPDNQPAIFGSGSEASLQYDGTDFIVDSSFVVDATGVSEGTVAVGFNIKGPTGASSTPAYPGFRIRLDGTDAGGAGMERLDLGWGGQGGSNMEFYSIDHGTRAGRLGLVYGAQGASTGQLLVTQNTGVDTWINRLAVDKDGLVNCYGGLNVVEEGDPEGLKLQHAYSAGNTSSRVFFAERDADDLGFSLLYAGAVNPVLGGKTMSIAANVFAIVRHNVSDAGSIVMSIGRGSDKVTFKGEVQIDGNLNHDGSGAGFYGTTPVAQQTGVAVTAAAIHAALVNLGLITA